MQPKNKVYNTDDEFLLSEIRRLNLDYELLMEKQKEVAELVEMHRILISSLQDQCDHQWEDRGGFMYAQWECTKCGAWASE